MATIRHRSNDRIREDITDALSSHGPLLPRMAHIQASAEAGVVTLRGHVPNATHKAIAGELASAGKGVRFVRNRLVDDHALLARIVTRFRWDDVTHRVHGPVQTFLGTVTLRGPAPSPAFGTRATQLALDTPGVRLVLNQVDVAFRAEPATVEAWFGRKAVVGGDEVGKVKEVLIDPVSWRVQAVVLVRRALSGLWTAVPASACRASDARYLYLDLTAREFRALPAGGAERLPAPEAHALGARTPVTSVWKQRLGRMAGVRFNPRDGQISDVIARRGRFFPAHVWLPMKAMSIGREGRLLTSLGADDLAARTEAGDPRPAEAIVRAAEGRLLFQGWRATPAGAITIASSERRLVVSGGMRHPADRVAIEHLLGSIPGVVGIENRIDIMPPELRCLPVASLPEGVAA